MTHFLFWNTFFVEKQMLSIFELTLLFSDYYGNFLNDIPLLRENKGMRTVGNCILLTALHF